MKNYYLYKSEDHFWLSDVEPIWIPAANCFHDYSDRVFRELEPVGGAFSDRYPSDGSYVEFTFFDTVDVNKVKSLDDLFRLCTRWDTVDCCPDPNDLVDEILDGCEQYLENKEPQDDPDVLLKSEMIDPSHAYEVGESMANMAADFMANVPVEDQVYYRTFDRDGCYLWRSKPTLILSTGTFYGTGRKLNDGDYNGYIQLQEITLPNGVTYDTATMGDTGKIINIETYGDGGSHSDDKSEGRVSHPGHYTWVPGIECNKLTQHFNFNLGNALKYIYRCGHKSEGGLSDKEKKVEDLMKAKQYIEFEINRVTEFE